MNAAPSWRHLLARKRVWLLAALLMGVALSYLFNFTERFDLAIYDSALPGGPAPDDITLVAIDEKSIAALGRWPWKRYYHAALVDQLRAAGVRSIAFDLLMPETDPGSPASDAMLATALSRGPPTVLPSFLDDTSGSRSREMLPIPVLQQAAAGIGHAQVEIDIDGIVRSLYLREGPGRPERLYLAAELLARTPGERLPAWLLHLGDEVSIEPGGWARQGRILIPYLGPPGHFRQVSYIDVLRGERDADLRGQIVLVGVTATGIGGHLPTPVSGQGRQLTGPMPGIEITANVLQALRRGTVIRPLNPLLSILLAVGPVVLVAFGLLRLAARPSLLLVLALCFATLGVSVALLRAGWWWPPATPLVALVLAYPLWSWLRLEATQAFLEDQFMQLARERFPLLAELPAAGSSSNDFVQRRLDLLRQATDRLRSVRRLFADTISSLPDATILADSNGRIVLANPEAARLFSLPGTEQMQGHLMSELLSPQQHGIHFAEIAAHAPCTREIALSAQGRHLLVRSAPFHDSAHQRVGTIVDFTDITELRAAQREREDVVRFLSHDMKSPATSLLGLAQLQRDPARALPAAELSQRLDLLAARMLTLLDSFVALARAESADPAAFESFDFRDAVQDAYDEVWAAARARGITIDPHLPDDPCPVSGDRRLLARAAVNLLGNAIKFSPGGSGITLSCQRAGDACTVRVADRGPGIRPEKAAALFQRFSRGMHGGERDPGGAGLGLAFVRVVAEKHRGRVWAEPHEGGGTVFLLSIPAEGPRAG
jgi:PAS domain S-box-containing protein